MFNDFSVIFHRDKTLLSNDFVPSGTIACMALNLPKDDITYLEKLYRYQRKGGDGTELRDMLSSIECVSRMTDLLPDDCKDILDQLICFRAYIRHFLLRYDVSGDSKSAWEAFLEKLDELVAQVRNMDNYYRTVLEPYVVGASVEYVTHSGSLCEKVTTTYGGVLLLDLLRSMEFGHPPRLCPCCEKWFIPSRGDEVYCGNLAPGAEGRTCREVGASRMFAKRADESQPIGLCRSACSRIYTRKNRGQLTAEEANRLTAECRRLRDLALNGAMTTAELEKRLEDVAGPRRAGKNEAAEV